MRREVVTLYGLGNVQTLALALAATVESDRGDVTHTEAVRHLGVWSDRGAIGDIAWRDSVTGQLKTQDLDIPLVALQARADALLDRCGTTLQQVVAGLATPDWPEGTDRALSFSLLPEGQMVAAGAGEGAEGAGSESWLDALRQADSFSYDNEDERDDS
jgi:hypothetical protein